MEIWLAYLILDLWETCGGFEGIISCNNRKFIESGWENDGSVIMRWLSPSQRNSSIKESALSSFVILGGILDNLM